MQILFTTNRDLCCSSDEIYVMDANGANQTRLTNNAAHDLRPNWSPDGTKIAFDSNRDGNFEIYVMNADGTNQIRLTTHLAHDYSPAWSPDGAQIAFTSERDGNAEIYVMNADGTDQTRLTNNVAGDFDPDWQPLPSVAPLDFYLHGTGSNNNPPTLFLDTVPPVATTAKFRDSAAVSFSGGNLWKDIGTWSAAPALSAGTLTTLSDLHIWLGLKNSDDQGTRFDLRAEVYKNGTLVASGETLCITGVTRNPALATEVAVAFSSFTSVAFDGSTDVLSLKVQTRIGTNGAGGFCGGHSNAVGLRVYFDAVNRPAKFDATL
jgi:WD40 repeat protein